jgi:hypothetical protein
MTVLRAIPPLFLLALASGLAFGQAPDPAAERARLANERIQIEAERRAQEELARQEQTSIPATAPGAQTLVTAQPPAAPSQPPARPPEPRPPVADMERTQRGLQQLRELGELKDAGHLTDAEFQRIKQRILDNHF